MVLSHPDDLAQDVMSLEWLISMLHNDFKSGMKVWEMGSVEALPMLFHNLPAQSKLLWSHKVWPLSTSFPCPLLGGKSVAKMAVEVWLVFASMRMRSLQNTPLTHAWPHMMSSRRLARICQSQPKLHFIVTLARIVQPCLTKYQTDEPLVPFLHHGYLY